MVLPLCFLLPTRAGVAAEKSRIAKQFEERILARFLPRARPLKELCARWSAL
jgi:hypothetical protein